MENKDSEKWSEAVFNSMRDSKTVSPSRDLFEDIQNRIREEEVQVVPFPRRIMGAAAAVLVLSLNIFAMNAYGFFENNSTAMMSSEASEAPELMSDFKIYE